jgi:hypothetical protein
MRFLPTAKQFMHLRGLIILIAIGSVCASAGHPSSEGAVGGTYEILICNSTCAADSSAIVRGRLVIADHAVPLTEVPPAALAYFRSQTRLLMTLADLDQAPNACFVLERNPAFRGFAGLTPVGLTRWEATTGDTISVAIDQSPDAGYVVSVVARDGTLSGRGSSWAAGPESRASAGDEIRGRRIGPADFEPCFRAAEDHANRLLALP